MQPGVAPYTTCSVCQPPKQRKFLRPLAATKPRFFNRTTSPPAPRMKAVILAGGLGTRLAEETHLLPKPMVEVGGKPMPWHILKTYSHYGINEFIICCGYKGYIIKE